MCALFIALRRTHVADWIQRGRLSVSHSFWYDHLVDLRFWQIDIVAQSINKKSYLMWLPLLMDRTRRYNIRPSIA